MPIIPPLMISIRPHVIKSSQHVNEVTAEIHTDYTYWLRVHLNELHWFTTPVRPMNYNKINSQLKSFIIKVYEIGENKYYLRLNVNKINFDKYFSTSHFTCIVPIWLAGDASVVYQYNHKIFINGQLSSKYYKVIWRTKPSSFVWLRLNNRE